jgi:L-serine deaminase
MKFRSFDKDKNEIKSWIIYSIGGGALANEETASTPVKPVYPLNNLHDIQEYCEAKGCSYWEYVEMNEGPEIWDFLQNVWDVMVRAVERGIETEGVLPGGLGVRRKASDYLIRAKGYKDNMKNRGTLYAYALATSEENAGGGEIVTAPTCGSCGVVPGVLYYLKKSKDFRDSRILRALATAGLFGSIVRQNASVSGAQVGCQGEVGVACAMAAAAACQLFGGTNSQIEYAAEMGLEHHLGLTCDPVCGLVQIPCIERNAYAAARALDCNTFATFSDGRHRVSFDKVVEVMRQTGHDLPSLYKETSEGGLAKNYYTKKFQGATE